VTDIDATIRAVVRDEIHRIGIAAPARALTVREAAERLAVDPKTIRRLIQTGELRAIRVGSRLLRVPSSDVDALLASAESQP
jgi:excisionase family DNA binding protein